MTDWSPVDVRAEFPFAPGQAYRPRPLADISAVVYHHGTGATPAANIAAEMAKLRDYHAFHVNERGWPAIAYHLAVGPSGTVYYLNNINLVTFHARQANETTVGIVFIGGFDPNSPPEPMLTAARRARGWVARQLGREDLPFGGHKDHVDTSCPGGWWPAKRALLEGLPKDAEDEAQVARLTDELVAERIWGTAILTEIGRWASRLAAAREARDWTAVRDVAATMHDNATATS